MATLTASPKRKIKEPFEQANPVVALQLMDYETFKNRIKEHEKGDLIEGVMKLKTPASAEHEDRFGILYVLLRMYVSAKSMGKVFGSRTLVRIDNKNGYEPDILFVAKESLDIIKTHEILGAPNVVVEIISKSSRIDDRVKKFQYYERLGVQEYWLIDPDYRLAEFYERVDDQFRQMDTDDDIFRSNAVSDFWFKLDWLFMTPPPNEFDLLQQILNPKHPA